MNLIGKDMKKLSETTRFLDNIIDVNLYPVNEINCIKDSRRIGLGVMGGQILYKLEFHIIPKKVMNFNQNF